MGLACSLQALLEASARDPDTACRAAAGELLSSLALHAATLTHLLCTALAREDAANDASSPSSPQRVRGSGQQRAAKRLSQAVAGQAGRRPGASGGGAWLSPEAVATGVLELILEREDIENAAQLVQPIQALVADMLAALAAPPAAEEGTGGPEGLPGYSRYLLQLALSCLRSIARRVGWQAPSLPPTANRGRRGKQGAQQQQEEEEGHGEGTFDLLLAVRAVQAAPDPASRNAALELLTCLSAARPQAVLEHALAIVALVGEASLLGADSSSEQVAARALTVVVGAWVHDGRSLEQLVGTVVDAADDMPPVKRLPTLVALVAALPEVRDPLAAGPSVEKLLQPVCHAGSFAGAML